uniref:Uncharacterized protein n=1 Tax=Onchocerca volvulus TaxID=6282 RepID=A0A8R1TMF6_ONCVO
MHKNIIVNETLKTKRFVTIVSQQYCTAAFVDQQI